ncbi:MAG: hypothetical protein GEU95_12630 [Rhizobiales bacterium]|nr:hypothetical protein [Hyphomicrobiales bacterium]
MTSSNDPPGGPAGQPGKRRPPTIDLKATEVASESAAGAETPREAQAAQSETAAAASVSSASGSDAPRAQPALSPSLLWPLAAAGIVGALVTLAILAGSGLLSSRGTTTMVADTRLARVEQQMRELAAKPLPVVGDAKAVDDLAGRLARLETQMATPRPPVADTAVANRIATLEGELKALSERVGVLGRRNDEIGAAANEARARADSATAAIAEHKKAQVSAAPDVQRTDIDALAGRIAALEQAAKALEAQFGARAAGADTDRTLRRVVAASALSTAVDRSAPFMTELGAAKAAASDPKALAALEPFAKTGLPSADVLARELTVLVPALAKAAGTSSREGGILDRLKASAEKIVRVRPIHEATGDDPEAVVRRIEMRAEQRDLTAAMTEIAKLPEPARALTKEWAAKVEARNAAIDASRRFSTDALASLGKPSL